MSVFQVIVFILLFFSYIPSGEGFFEIVEVFPNTVDDKNLEYITLKNTSNQSRSLSGFTLADKKKEFVFEEDIILEPGERMKFSRPETKLVLNNSNEEIYLYSTEGELTDSVEYGSSVKGEFLSFEDLSDMIDSELSIISDEGAIISDEALLNDISDSGLEQVTVTKELISVNESEDIYIPELQISFQRPSYVSQSGSSNVYICDQTRDECKINFDLRGSFSPENPEKEYECRIDFGLGETIGQEERCNPNTVIFPEGKFFLAFRIYSELDTNSYTEKSIEIHNVKTGGNSVENLGTSQETENLEAGGNQEIITTKTLEAPKILFELQRPSYVTQSGSTDVYICDRSREECKINFNLESSFTSEFKKGDYVCEIDFGLGELIGEEYRCNPNTVIIPVGNQVISFKILHKEDSAIFSEKMISVINTGYSPGTQTSLNSSVGISPHQNISIGLRPIIIQSGVIESGFNIFQCKKEKCSMNLEYIGQHKDERCLWNFGGGVASNPTTHTRCNPGIIKFDNTGEFRGSLMVYEKGNDENFKKRYFRVYNLGDIGELRTPTNIEEEGEESFTTQELQLRIELQGRISKEKTLGDDMLLCSGVEKCYVNLTGNIEGSTKGLRHTWLVNGEEFSEKLNPKGIWLELGDHEIELQVFREESLQESKSFYIRVSPRAENSSENNNTSKVEDFIERDMSGIIFGDILPNPRGKDMLEFIQIRNTSSEQKDLSGCILTDGSRKYIFQNEILEAGEIKYFFKMETKISLGNSKDSVSLSCGTEILQDINYERRIADNELLSGDIFPGFTLAEILSLIPEENHEEIISLHAKLNFRILKRDGLKISGNTFPNTKLELISGSQVLLTLVSDSEGKVLLKTKNILAGKYNYDIRIYDYLSEYYITNIGKVYITQAERNSWFTKKVSTKKNSTKTLPKLILTTYADDNPVGTSAELNIRQKIGLLFFVSLCMLLCVISLFLKLSQRLSQSFIVHANMLHFSMRQKTYLILS